MKVEDRLLRTVMGKYGKLGGGEPWSLEENLTELKEGLIAGMLTYRDGGFVEYKIEFPWYMLTVKFVVYLVHTLVKVPCNKIFVVRLYWNKVRVLMAVDKKKHLPELKIRLECVLGRPVKVRKISKYRVRAKLYGYFNRLKKRDEFAVKRIRIRLFHVGIMSRPLYTGRSIIFLRGCYRRIFSGYGLELHVR